MTAPTAHAVYCEECEELECVHCHSFNAYTTTEIDEHAQTCPYLFEEPGDAPQPCLSCPRFYWPEDGDGGRCFICRLDAAGSSTVVTLPPLDMADWPPLPGRFVPPGSRWWCEPAVDLTDRLVGRRVCATCWNAVLTDDYLCRTCFLRSVATR